MPAACVAIALLGKLFGLLMIDAGVQMDLTRTQAQELTLHTIADSVELMLQTHEHPAVLRNKVTSPGGVTGAGLLKWSMWRGFRGI
ncbi:MAG: pyrroline-5-carboxylate reductase dimerization domain-containing protein [Nostoc sp.]|uniref:pyrroline-5-carboxylate reductase family protein n=1 Tax=Nostoc sp. TaxID=1180 RepID=UPI002FFC1B3D